MKVLGFKTEVGNRIRFLGIWIGDGETKRDAVEDVMYQARSPNVTVVALVDVAKTNAASVLLAASAGALLDWIPEADARVFASAAASLLR